MTVDARSSRARDGIHVVLVDQSAPPVRVDYTLTTGSSGNQATQGGAARLEPERPATLLALTQHGSGDWSGVLEVRVDGRAAYRLVLSAPN